MSNVRDFGALGDGQNDDTAAIEHAVEQGDGELEFPRGDYRITRTVKIDLSQQGRFAMQGASGVAKVIMDGPGPAFHLVGSHTGTADPLSFRPELWQRERMPILRELEIEGRHPEADGIRLEGVMQPTLTSLLIREVRHAVHLTGRARNVTISHCHFYHNTGVGVFLDRVNLHQTIITGSHLSYCRLGGIRIEESEIRNLQITGNDIEYNNDQSHSGYQDDPASSADILIDVGQHGTVREGTIVGNTIQATASPGGANVRILGSDEAGSHRAGMWTISGNLIGSQQTNVHLRSVRGVTLTGNYLYSGHHRNLTVEHARNVVVGPNCLGHNPDYRENELATGIRFEDCENCSIQGVLIEDAEAGRHTLPGVEPIEREALIELVRCRRMNLSGVQVLDPTPIGIDVQDCTETLLTGCTVLDDRVPTRMKWAIRWRGAGDGNALVGCRFGAGIEGAVDVPKNVRRLNLIEGQAAE